VTRGSEATIAIPAGALVRRSFPWAADTSRVAELTLAIAALRRETGKPLPLRGIAFASLRHLVLRESGSNCRPVNAPPRRAKRRACASN